MLTLACMSTNSAHICLNKSAAASFYPFVEKKCDILRNVWLNVMDGHYTMFIGKLTNRFTSFVVLFKSYCLSTQRVNLCPVDFKRKGNSTQRPLDI